MSITSYIKDIGRGKDGARNLTREQAADLFGQVLDGTATDLQVGAFVLAMRIKGETPQEMAGFLDATAERLHKVPTQGKPTVVLPSYNGARKLPVLTPLLGLLLAREGLAVVVHGSASEDSRISSQNVLQALGIPAQQAIKKITPSELQFVPTTLLSPGLVRLLEVRRVVGLRNSAHSLVKLMNPCDGPAVVVGSYTHPEYAVSMTDTLKLTHAHALLLRGTEGEPVADPRRTPAMDAICNGECTRVQEAQSGSLTQLPGLPELHAEDTARWTQDVLAGKLPVPTSITQQVAHIVRLSAQISLAEAGH
jgi:anthranilate phosphoribosyltransferase